MGPHRNMPVPLRTCVHTHTYTHSHSYTDRYTHSFLRLVAGLSVDFLHREVAYG